MPDSTKFQSLSACPTLLATSLCLTACGTSPSDTPTETESSESDTGSADELTWWRDVQPIVSQKCANCHSEGNIAPFALETHEQFASFAVAVAPAIETGLMPPWPPDDDCNSYKYDRSLTLEQQETLLDYLAGDMPEGDPADAPPAPEPLPELVPDVVVEMPEAYVPNIAPDDYRCFPIPWPAELTEETFVTGSEVYPGDRSIVHHVIMFVAEPDKAQDFLDLDAADPGAGYTCFGGPGGPPTSARWLGAWVPGMVPFMAPEGVGQRVSPGSLLIMQVHYNIAPGNTRADQSTMGFSLASQVDRHAIVLPVTNPAWLAENGSMLIPAGDAEATHEFSFTLGNPVLGAMVQAELGPSAADEIELWNAGLHMHLFGKHGRLAIRDADDNEQSCLLDIPAWDFHWQSGYDFVTSKRLRADQQLHLQCWWDNSADNQPIVDGQPLEPIDRDWGEGTLDEMCLGVVYATAVQ